ncbi:right-handed parallel beta-helix repeat-containing protein, partial [Myxococcota bacterium]|nr:right-handed parallel beta-helix repeat-containing protein [Myxococcota bacterium]
SHVYVDKASGYGMLVSDSTAVGTFTDVVVTNTKPEESSGYFGFGFYSGGTGVANIDRALFEGNHLAGLASYGIGTQVTATNVVSRATLLTPGNPANLGHGVFVNTGSEMTLSSALVEGNPFAGIHVTAEKSYLTLSETVIRDNTLDATGYRPGGLEISSGGSAEVDQVIVENNMWFGIAIEPDGTLEGSNLVVTGTQAYNEESPLGFGIINHWDTIVSLSQCYVSDNTTMGVYSVGEEGSTPGEDVNISLRDVIITDTRPDPFTGDGGIGLYVVNGHMCTMENVTIDRNLFAGLAFANQCEATVSNLVIRDTDSSENYEHPGYFGWGLSVESGSTFSGSHVLIEGAKDTGALFYDTAHSTLDNVVIRGTTPVSCALYESSDPAYCLAQGETAVSRALTLEGGSIVLVTDFEFSDNGTMGVHVLLGLDSDRVPFESGPNLVLTNGGFLDHEVGICIDDLPEFNEMTLHNNVYHDEEVMISYDHMAAPITHYPDPEEQ